MKHNKTITLAWLAIALLTTVAKGGNPELPVNLGSAGNFVILAKSGISTVPPADITGDLGVSPIDSTAITGFALIMDVSNTFSTSAQVTGKIYAADYGLPTPGNMTTAISDMETAYTQIAGRPLPDATELMSGDISGLTITPGLYKWSTGVLINSDVWLDAAGNPDAIFIFQIAGDLTMAGSKKIILAGGAQAKNIFWQVGGGSGAVIGTYAHFEGIILAANKIDLLTGSSFNGKLFSQKDVNLQSSTVVDSSLLPSLFRLEIVSEHGIANPTTGLYFHVSGTLLTNSISDTETLPGGTQYVNTGWTMIGNSETAGFTNSMQMTLTNNAVLTWQWSTNYFLSLTATNGVILNATEGWKPAGSSYGLFPQADINYVFDHWELNGTLFGNGVPLSLTMDEAKNIVAVFIPLAVTNLTLEIVSEHGIASPTTGLYTHASGTLLTNSISDIETLPGGTQYVNTGWSMISNSETAGITNSMSMTLTNNAVLTWQWSTNYFLSLTATNALILGTAEGWKPANSNYQLTAQADPGYTFDHWELDGLPVGSGVPLSVTMDAAKDVVAVFAPLPPSLLSLEIVSEHGVGNPTTGLYFHASGTLLTNSVSASETFPGGTQYVNRGWTMIGNSETAGLTNGMQMTLTNNAVLTWQWNTNYFLTLIAVNGVITNAVAGWKPDQSFLMLYPEADLGYAFDHWEVNGIPFGAGVPLTLTMNEAKNVVAVFSTLFINVSSNVNWNVTWVFDPRKGFFLGSLTIMHTNGLKRLMAPFWFEVASTEYHWLRTPSGLDAQTGMHYLDISSAFTSQLPGIGNGDLAIDPGESVTVTGIELMGRRTPDGLLMAVWADPPVLFTTRVDTDGDGMPDADEYVAGTSVTDAASLFRIRLSVDHQSVQWDGQPNRLYTVLTSTNLSQGFVIETENIPSTGGPMTHTVGPKPLDGDLPGMRFYRVNVNVK